MRRQERRATVPKRVLAIALAAASFGAANSAAASPIADAAMTGDAAAVRRLIGENADVDAVQADGSTALHWAVYRTDAATAAALVQAGASVGQPSRAGATPLSLACQAGNVELVRLHEEGATPFLRAAQSSDLELMKLLLEHGADPTLTTNDGTTPLMVASGIGWVEGVTYEWSREANVEAVNMLLDLGLDVNAQNSEGRTALMGAAHKGRNEIVQRLVDRGADLAARDIGSRDTIHKLAGLSWRAIDYADGLVRVGVQSAIPHPETSALLRRLMIERGIPVPPEGRTLESICVTDICRPDGGTD